MLTVRLEVNGLIEIGRMDLVNDGTGTDEIANYDVHILGQHLRVLDHDRRNGAWVLVRRALFQAAGAGVFDLKPGSRKVKAGVKERVTPGRVVGSRSGAKMPGTSPGSSAPLLPNRRGSAQAVTGRRDGHLKKPAPKRRKR